MQVDFSGSVGEFIAERETFCSYVEWMAMFLTANNIVETMEDGSTLESYSSGGRKETCNIPYKGGNGGTFDSK